MSDELIRRYDVLGKAQWIGSPATWDDPWPEGKEAVTVEDIEAVPAVDAVEVVRCRECKYRDSEPEVSGEEVMVCTGPMAYFNTPDNWFCAGGQRREEEHNAVD